MDHAITAIYDANVLYSAPLRDLLIRLAQAGLVRARWTEAIHDEWTRAVLANHPHITAERIARTRLLMNAAVRDCVVTGYEGLIDSLTLPDADDRHVLAAAIRSAADVIVTFNLADYPADALGPFDLVAQHPDDFVTGLLDMAPGAVCSALKAQRKGLRNPPQTAEELLATLESQGLVQAVAQLRQFVTLL